MALRRERGRHGIEMPVIGLGTWHMGESPASRKAEIAALRLGLDLGLYMIDTAEMYADGGAEEVVAEAIEGRRDEVFLVSKVLPDNASREGTVRAAEAGLRRLRTDRLDLYLLHWPGSHPLADTYEAFERLVEAGKIRHFGVSNFDVSDMEHSETLAAGARVTANQVLYNLGRRGIEDRLVPWCRGREIPIMAYTPLEPAPNRALNEVAARHGVSTQRIALAWTIREPGVVTIPKASRPEHVRDNAAAADIRLTARDLEQLDAAYPAPPPGHPLETA